MTSKPRLVVSVLLGLLASTPAYGQSQGGQPPRPLFGGGTAPVGQSLTLGLSLGQSLFRTETRRAGEDSDIRDDSLFTVASGGLAYSLEGTRAGASASLSSSGQYYSELTDRILHGYGGTVGAWVKATERTRLQADHAVTYQPGFQNAFQNLLDPTGLLNQPPGDISASDDPWLSHNTRVALTQTVTRRSSLIIDYGRHKTDFRATDLVQTMHDAGIRYTHQLSASFGLRAGYRYRTNEVSDETSNEGAGDLHTIDAGLDFSRAFSLSRRTTLGVSTGSTVTQNDDQTQLFLTGNAVLSHRMGRTWSAAISGGRDVGFMNGLLDPVVSDRVTANLSGNLARRVQAQAFASALRGRIAGAGDDGDADAFVTYLGGAGLGIGLTRTLQWTMNYAYQRSDFGSVPFLVAPQLQSLHAASTGLAISPWRYVGLNVSYSYAVVERDGVNMGRNRRQSVTASVTTSLPLYATARK